MRTLFAIATPLIALLPLLSSTNTPASSFQEGDDPMAAAMAKAMVYTQPGANHAILERFLGQWDTELRLFFGSQAGPPTKGACVYSWLMEGRWLQSTTKGSMNLGSMEMPLETFVLLGYDNFKMSYVMTTLSSVDTAMSRFEGDMDPSGEAMLLYGTIDEYMTGEHDKMVKSVIRFVSDDEMVLEVHDLPIGEKNTKVFEIRYRRKAR